MSEAVTRALILAKTYPELSKRHVETVCTGAVLEDGRPLRLYPVPLRYLAKGGQYKLYDWIEVPARKSTKDPRPESFRINPDGIKIVGHIDPARNWQERALTVLKYNGWQFPDFEALKAARAKNQVSMGIVTPQSVLGVEIRRKPTGARKEHDQRLQEIQGQGDLFRRSYKRLEFLPNTVSFPAR